VIMQTVCYCSVKYTACYSTDFIFASDFKFSKKKKTEEFQLSLIIVLGIV
jgi:hypothetical protein